LLEKISHYHKEKEKANVVTLTSGKPLMEVPTKKYKERELNKGNPDNPITIQDEEESIKTKEIPKKSPQVRPYMLKILFSQRLNQPNS